MAVDRNGNALTINDWVEYTDDFRRCLGLDTTIKGQITKIEDRENGWSWVYVDWIDNTTAPVAACKCKLIHSYEV